MHDGVEHSRQRSLQEIYLRQTESTERETRQEYEQSIQAIQEALKHDGRNPELYIDLAKCHGEREEHATALEALREGIARCALSLKLHHAYVEKLRKLNRIEEAIEAARRTMRLFPDDLSIRVKESLILPAVYQTAEEIGHYRQRFSDGLAALDAEISLETPAARDLALEAVASHRNFLLCYQGENDLELQQRYGKLVQRIVAANFPEWTNAGPMPSVDGRLRIGYVSSYFATHSSVEKVFLGWLLQHDRSRFQICAYQVGIKDVAVANELRRCDAKVYHLPTVLEDVAHAIRSDNLHILVFLDIGRVPIMTLLAALRLAPVQCMAWDHPVTSGLPTVDYFLSNELMEPSNGQDHYSERLIRLPGVGMCCRKPVIPRALLEKRRCDFGLSEDRVLYLSCQSLFKYLPQHDDVFPAIAKRIPNSQFVFVAPNDSLLADFQRRLERSFSVLGLSAKEHCVFLPKQEIFPFWNLNLLADVYLDTIDWSGCVTTLEAIACGLPIVTAPGRFMRGRQGYGLLTQFGATETIARDKADYVNVAVRLGDDPGWRAHVVQRMKDGAPRFYSDTSSLAALENFYQDAVKQHLVS